MVIDERLKSDWMQSARMLFGPGVAIEVREDGGAVVMTVTGAEPAVVAGRATRPSAAAATGAERQRAIARKVVELRSRYTPEELARHLGRRRRLEDLAAAEIDHQSDSFGEPVAKATTPAAVAERLRLDRVQRALRILAERPADALIARAIAEGKVDRRGAADLSALTDEMVERNEDLVGLAEREIRDVFTAEDLDHQARACHVTRDELVRRLAIDRLRDAGVAVASADVCKVS